MYWQKHPLFRLLLPFVTGMIAADATAILLTQNIIALFTTLCLCAILLFMQNRRKSRDSFYPRFGIAAMAFFLLLGATLYTLSFNSVQRSFSPDANRGTVIQPPSRKAHSWAVTLQTDNGARLIAYIDDQSDSTAISGIHPGDTLTFAAQSFSPTSPLLQQESDTSFAPYRTHLFYSGISATCYIRHNAWSVTPSSGNPSATFTRWRTAAAEAYRSAGLSDDEGALIEAITIGNKTRLTNHLKTHYSRAGISHVLALSGFHLTVIFAMLHIMLYAIILPYRWQWVKSLIIIASLWTFTMIAGSPPSLVRAAIMCTLMSVSGCLGRPVLSINSLTIAAFLMLCINPLVLNDVGFQLSFISVLAICTIAIPICRHIEERMHYRFPSERTPALVGRHILKYLIGVVVISLTCTVATAPLVAYHFHTIPLLSVLTNLLVSLLAVALLYTAALWWLLFWCDGAKSLLTEIMQSLASTMNAIAEWISSVSWAVVAWSPDKLQFLLSYALIMSVTTYFYRRTATTLKLTLIILVALLATFL